MKYIKLFVVVIILFACSRSGNYVSSPWEEKYRPYFDDSIDVIGDLSRLEGQWAKEQMDQLEGRVFFSDLTAQVEILSIQTVVETERESMRIQIRLDEVLYGTGPGETMEVSCESDQPGFEMFKKHEQEGMLNKPYYVFIKWYEDDDNELRKHFHFTIADPSMDVLVRTLVDKRLAEDEKKKEGRYRSR